MGLVIVAGTFVLSIAEHLTYALVFSTPAMSHIYFRARRGIQATLGAFFTFAGLKLLFSRPYVVVLFKWQVTNHAGLTATIMILHLNRGADIPMRPFDQRQADIALQPW